MQDSTYPVVYAIWSEISTKAATNISQLSYMHMAEVYDHGSADRNVYWLITVIVVKNNCRKKTYNMPLSLTAKTYYRDDPI